MDAPQTHPCGQPDIDARIDEWAWARLHSAIHWPSVQRAAETTKEVERLLARVGRIRSELCKAYQRIAAGFARVSRDVPIYIINEHHEVVGTLDQGSPNASSDARTQYRVQSANLLLALQELERVVRFDAAMFCKGRVTLPSCRPTSPDVPDVNAVIGDMNAQGWDVRTACTRIAERASELWAACDPNPTVRAAAREHVFPPQVTLSEAQFDCLWRGSHVHHDLPTRTDALTNQLNSGFYKSKRKRGHEKDGAPAITDNSVDVVLQAWDRLLGFDTIDKSQLTADELDEVYLSRIGHWPDQAWVDVLAYIDYLYEPTPMWTRPETAEPSDSQGFERAFPTVRSGGRGEVLPIDFASATDEELLHMIRSSGPRLWVLPPSVPNHQAARFVRLLKQVNESEAKSEDSAR